MGKLNWVHGPDWPGVSVRFSTRQGGVSAGRYAALNLGSHVGDQPEAVAENRARVVDELSSAPIWLNQVHGVAVLDADADAMQTNIALPQSQSQPQTADAAVTRTPGRVLAIMVADCLPVAIVNTEGTILGAAHAGWKGLAAGVLEQTVLAMQQHQPCDLASYKAWIGPAIGPAAFEVGSEVMAAFLRDDPGASDCFEARPDVSEKWLANLPALAERRLRRIGVTSVVQSNRCTYSEPEHFFSYRRDGQTGRMALFVSLTPG